MRLARKDKHSAEGQFKRDALLGIAHIQFQMGTVSYVQTGFDAEKFMTKLVGTLMSSERVWLSLFPGDSTRMKNFDSDVWLKDKDRAYANSKLQMCATPLSAADLPVEMYFAGYRLNASKFPEFFKGGGFFVMSRALKAVFEAHDLGKTTFKPVTLYARDRKTLTPGEWFTINFGETKDSYLPEKSEGSYPGTWIDGTWKIPPTAAAENDVVALAPAALSGVDFWKEETVPRVFFFSDRLAKALKDAKLAKWFRLKRCRIDRTALH